MGNLYNHKYKRIAETNPAKIFITELVDVRLSGTNISYYRNLLGDNSLKMLDYIKVNPALIELKTQIKAKTKCPLCDKIATQSLANINKSGHTYCVGCKNLYDLTGLRFGKLIAISLVQIGGHCGSVWHCKCDCGNTTDVAIGKLSNGWTKTCGDYVNHRSGKDNPSFVNLKGKIFDRLEVIKHMGVNRYRNSLWLCRCICGHEFTTASVNLTQGFVDSCGCKDSFERTRVNRRTGGRYSEWRETVLSRDSYTCRICASDEKIHAHHIFSYKKYPKKRFDVNNGVALCQECHKEFHKCYGSGGATIDAFVEFCAAKIDKETYESMVENMPELDFSLLHLLESEDNTTVAQELACVGGVCEI